MSFTRLLSAGCLALLGIVTFAHGCGGGSDENESGGAGSSSAGSGAGQAATGGRGGTSGNDGGQAGDESSGGGAENAAGEPGFEPTCEPVYANCTGLCGPVRDPCTGETFECGGCAEGLACDVLSHT
jgi:hypothetical protein